MTFHKYVFASSTALLLAGWMMPGIAGAATIFSEDFEPPPPILPGQNITTSNTAFDTVTITVGTPGTGSTLHAITDDGTVFASNNQYLHYQMGTAPATLLASGTYSTLSNTAFHFSFDFRDIEDVVNGSGNPTQFRLFLGNGGIAAANRVVELGFNNNTSGTIVGTLQSFPGGSASSHATYALGTTHHIDVVGSLGTGTKTYTGPDAISYTLGDGKFDIWLNGTRVTTGDGVAFRTATTQLTHIGFSVAQGMGGTLDREQNIYLDNIVLRDAVDFTVIPEPSAFVLAGIALVGLGLVGWRRKTS